MTINALIGWVIRFRGVVLGLTTLATLASLYALRIAPLDAIPDIADAQVVIYAKWQRSPALLQAEIADPVVKALLGAPGIESVRATSHMGYSFIYATLDSTVEREQGRELVASRLNSLRPALPRDASIVLGPDAGSMGWVYQYAIVDKTQTRDLRELRLLHESLIKPALQTVPGIAEVASVGGLEKQFQLKLFPPLLETKGLSLTRVCDALRDALDEVGGRAIEVANRDYQVRGVLKDRSLEQLERLVIGRDRGGQPVLLKDVGYFQVGYDLRRSIADLNGTGEVVGAIVVMRQGSNVLAVTGNLERKLDEVKRLLPAGVEIVTTYKRSTLIWNTVRNFLVTLGYELAVVVIVVLVFLRNVRSALAPISVLILATLLPHFRLRRSARRSTCCRSRDLPSP